MLDKLAYNNSRTEPKATRLRVVISDPVIGNGHEYRWVHAIQKMTTVGAIQKDDVAGRMLLRHTTTSLHIYLVPLFHTATSCYVQSSI